MIHVDRMNDDTFSVTVTNGGKTTHRVTLPDDYHARLTGGGTTKEELIQRSFEFLLQREPKESILSSFELSVIQQYFPEYEQTISSR
jgi:hypothetical protein